MDENCSVVIIGSFAPSLINFRGKLIESLVSKGMKVIAMAPEIDLETGLALRRMGAEPLSYNLQRTGMNVVNDLGTFWKLYRVFKSRQPDVVLGYTIKPMIYGSIAARLAGVKSIYSMVTGLGFAFSGSTWRQKVISVIASVLLRVAFSGNQIVFFQNPDDREIFENRRLLAKGKARLINGSGVDTDAFALAPPVLEPRFLMIARFLKEKGVYEYVKAARAVRRECPSAKFDLAGWLDDGPSAISANELKTWIEEGTINHLGHLRDVRDAIRNCSVYVLPSYREGTPRTVLEAMAMGRPVLTTDAPGCRETVTDGDNGFLVPVGDSDTLAHAMQRFIKDPSLIEKMGQRSREIALGKYDVYKVNSAILKEMRL